MLDLSTQNLWLNIDKPIGFSSAKVVAIIKRFTKAKKVGHGGTLDPFASGVLPVALNKATKTSDSWMAARKKYAFQITWGEFRDTDDVEGKCTESSSKRPTTSEIISALIFFSGRVTQIPSRFSAIRINGKRAYELARQDIQFAMPPREIEIFSLKLISNTDEFCEIEIECSKGTYVRTLARDLATRLGVCGYVSKLTRLQVGKFLYEKRISLDELKLASIYATPFFDGLLLSDAGCLFI
jgi:tRNA pseudouridine55 synthase